jgi:hypothetical protein
MGSLADASGRRYSGPPVFLSDGDEHRRLIANAVLGVLQGKLNNTGTFTITDNVATTALSDVRIGANSAIFAMPTTANAAAAIATMYFNTFAEGSCVINHANNAQTDRVFVYAVFG